MKAFFFQIWNYRSFILGSVKREFQAKYRNSILGAAWTVLNPLAMIVVYTVIFAQVMKAKLPGVDSTFAYSIYLCSGVLTWGLFAEIVGRGQIVFLENANLLKKLSFPRICLPIITVLNAGVNFGIVASLFMAFLLFSGNFPGWVIFAAIPVIILQVTFAIGLGVLLGVLNVFFRDVGQFFGIFIQFWFWFTPVVYSVNILPENISKYISYWNPMAPIVGAYQAIFVSSQLPQWGTLLIPLLLSIVFCVLAARIFRKRAGEMVDEL